MRKDLQWLILILLIVALVVRLSWSRTEAPPAATASASPVAVGTVAPPVDVAATPSTEAPSAAPSPRSPVVGGGPSSGGSPSPAVTIAGGSGSGYAPSPMAAPSSRPVASPSQAPVPEPVPEPASPSPVAPGPLPPAPTPAPESRFSWYISSPDSDSYSFVLQRFGGGGPSRHTRFDATLTHEDQVGPRKYETHGDLSPDTCEAFLARLHELDIEGFAGPSSALNEFALRDGSGDIRGAIPLSQPLSAFLRESLPGKVYDDLRRQAGDAVDIWPR